MLSLNDPVAIPCKEDTFTLALLLRFDNERFSPFIVKLFFKTFWVCW